MYQIRTHIHDTSGWQHVRKPMVRNADGTVSHDVYYVLSQSQKTFKKISASLIDR